jgi:hypothetical protein
MRTKKTAGVFLFVAVIVLAAIGWRYRIEVLTSGATLDEVARANRRLATEFRELERKCTDLDREIAKLKEASQAFQMASPLASETKTAMMPRRGPLSIAALLRNDPEAEVFFLASRRSELAQKYGPFYRRLQLSAAQVAQFQGNMIKLQEAEMDLTDVLGRDVTGANRSAVAKLLAGARRDYDEAQRALLGEAGYAEFQDYERTSSYRAVVSAVAGVAALERVPFSAEQADRLVAAIAENSDSYRHGGRPGPDIDWEAVVDRARGMLSPAQFGIFCTMDPGSTTGGMLQAQMAGLIDRVKQAEVKKESAWPAKSPSDR